MKLPFKRKRLDPYQKGARLRKIIRIMITILTILLVDLSISYLNSVIVNLGTSNVLPKYTVTLLGIVVVVGLFMLLVEYLNDISEWILKFFVDIGRSMMGRKTGLYLTFIILLLLIYSGYYWVWFKGNLWVDIWNSAVKTARPILPV